MGIQSVTPVGSTVPAPAAPAAPAPAAAAAEGSSGTGVPEVDIKPEELGRWSKLHRENREQRARLAELETKAADVDKFKPEAERAT